MRGTEAAAAAAAVYPKNIADTWMFYSSDSEFSNSIGL